VGGEHTRDLPGLDQQERHVLVRYAALARVRERGVAEVVQERRDPHQLGVPDPSRPRERRSEQARHVTRAHAVHEPAVLGAGVHEVGQAELFDTAKALKGAGVDERGLDRAEVDEAVNGIADAVHAAT
jgi:hypothetical protein